MFNLTDLKQEIEDILHPKKKLILRGGSTGHIPPRAPIISEKSGRDYTLVESVDPGGSQIDSKPIIDFSYLANNSSFQRSIIEFIKKFVPGFENVNPRGSKEVMAQSFDQNAQNYSAVMNEFKEKLAKVKVK